MDRAGDRVLEPLHQIVEREADCGAQTDRMASFVEKRRATLESKRLGEQRVIAEYWMNVEWEVGAVDGEVSGECGAHFSVRRADHWLHPAPKQPVMHEQQVDSTLDGFADNRFAGIHCRANLGNDARIFNLQPVPGRRPIGDLANAKVGVKVAGEERKTGHWRTKRMPLNRGSAQKSSSMVRRAPDPIAISDSLETKSLPQPLPCLSLEAKGQWRGG